MINEKYSKLENEKAQSLQEKEKDKLLTMEKRLKEEENRRIREMEERIKKEEENRLKTMNDQYSKKKVMSDEELKNYVLDQEKRTIINYSN